MENVAGVPVDVVRELDDEDPTPDDVRDAAVDVVSWVARLSVVDFAPSVCVMVCVSEAGMAVVVREGVEEETTTKLGPDSEMEDVDSGPLAEELDDGSAPEGLRYLLRLLNKFSSRLDRLPRMGFPSEAREVLCGSDLDE